MPPRGRKLTAVPTEPKVGTVASGVQATIAALDLRPEDEALRVLALEYAATMDKAATIAAVAAKIPFSEDTEEELRKLRARVSALVTVSDLGPKLLTALDALQATPKARASAGKPPGPGRTSKLSEFRAGVAG